MFDYYAKVFKNINFSHFIVSQGAEYALDCTEIKEKLEEFLSNCHVVVKPASGNTKEPVFIY